MPHGFIRWRAWGRARNRVQQSPRGFITFPIPPPSLLSMMAALCLLLLLLLSLVVPCFGISRDDPELASKLNS